MLIYVMILAKYEFINIGYWMKEEIYLSRDLFIKCKQGDISEEYSFVKV